MIRYGLQWPADADDLMIEFSCIRKGGRWKESNGIEYGLGLLEHYKNAQKLLWPNDYHTRWTDLELTEILTNTITAIMGPKDTGKTHVALVRYGLTDYFCFPNNTLIIVSSTTLNALEMRVWGDMKNMFRQAKERYDWLPGVMLESKHAISTDDLDDESVISRDMRKGIVCVACKTSTGSFTGIASYVGMKQERRRHLGDEFQFMAPAMMDSIANMNSGDYKGVFVGNPIGQNDPLDQISEPECGWESFEEPKKTTVWKNKKFLNSKTICLYGPDSPTFDFPDGPKRYPGLINADSIARVVAGYGKDSHQYYSQCLGVRRVGLNSRRVITKEICRQFGAFDKVIWDGTGTTKVCALDAAYGGTGGDRCIGGHGEFGKDINGKIILFVHPPQIVPVSVRNKVESPEDQISRWSENYCIANGIPPQNYGYDSTGRGTLGSSLARIWKEGGELVNPIEFGGTATDRPVSLDHYVWDAKLRQRRLKTCREHYSKFVTELWWTVRLCIESGQLRGLTEAVADEGCAREWKEVAGGRIEVETKADMKLRVGYSPDCFVAGTLIKTEFGEVPIEQIEMGDLVVTPFGISPVVAIHVRETKELTTANFNNGSHLTGLGKHKVFTWDKGWVRLDSLSIDNECESSDNINLWQKANGLFTKGTNIGFKAMVDIFQETSVTQKMKGFSIESFGRNIMDQFQKAIASITKMEIGETIELRTCNSWKQGITKLTTWLSDQSLSSVLLMKLPQLGELLPAYGMAHLRERNGIARTQNDNGKFLENDLRQDVANVEKLSSLILQHVKRGIVPSSAETWPLGERQQMIKGIALFAARRSLHTNTAPQKLAPLSVERTLLQGSKKVYNLTLAADNAYYANGILVQNCFDWLVTILEMARRRGFQISKLGNAESDGSNWEWWYALQDKQRNMKRDHVLNHAA